MNSYFENVIKIRDNEKISCNSLADLLSEAISVEKQIFIMGNGGSCAIACHFVADLNFIKSELGDSKIFVKSLCSNLPMITSISNDLGFEQIFSKQLQIMGKAGDICVLISSSGNSKNLINAFNFCIQNSLEVILILGFDGGKLKEIARPKDYVLHFNSEIGQYGPVEDVHQSVCHEIASLLKQKLGISA